MKRRGDLRQIILCALAGNAAAVTVNEAPSGKFSGGVFAVKAAVFKEMKH